MFSLVSARYERASMGCSDYLVWEIARHPYGVMP